jgi:hypothetical protein
LRAVAYLKPLPVTYEQALIDVTIGKLALEGFG